MREGRVVIVAPIDDTPAQRAGLAPDVEVTLPADAEPILRLRTRDITTEAL